MKKPRPCEHLDGALDASGRSFYCPSCEGQWPPNRLQEYMGDLEGRAWTHVGDSAMCPRCGASTHSTSTHIEWHRRSGV